MWQGLSATKVGFLSQDNSNDSRNKSHLQSVHRDPTPTPTGSYSHFPYPQHMPHHYSKQQTETNKWTNICHKERGRQAQEEDDWEPEER